jgi:flagellar hook-basal body complex protein FliE
VNDILSISTLPAIAPLKSIDLNTQKVSGEIQVSNSGDFSTFLQNAVSNLEKTQTEAASAVEGLTTGEISDFHVPVIALQKARYPWISS